MIVLSFVYLPIMFMIYSHRHTQAVSFKSPQLILLGGIALYIDAICNILLLNELSDKLSCYLSIIVTLTIHYIGYLSLIFRAQRIFRIMSIEAMFLDDIYDFSHIVSKSNENEVDMSQSQSIDNSPLITPILNGENSDVLSYEQFKAKKQIELKKHNKSLDQQIASCKEITYIKRIGYVMAVTSVLAVVSILKPDPLFTFIPIFHSYKCLREQSEGSDYLEFWKLTTNQVAFVLINYLELLFIVLTWMKLRKVKKDQLNIKNEFEMITFGWTAFSIFYFISVQVGNNIEDKASVKVAQILGIVCIQLRNLVAFLAQTCQTLKQSRS